MSHGAVMQSPGVRFSPPSPPTPSAAAWCPRPAPAPGTAAAGTTAGGRPPLPPASHPGGPWAAAPHLRSRRDNGSQHAAALLLPLRKAVRGLHHAPRTPAAPRGSATRRAPARRHRVPTTARLPPRTFHSYLPRSHRTYSCIHCRAHLARHEELISKSFQGSHGRAYLFNSVVNVGCGPAEQRLLLTGLHSVADIFCESCKTTLGWKYEQAFESSQKYKEGKFIIEMSHMVKENGWD
eukprot:XP_003641379.3 protein yippee-like 4 [Gallus gallus]